VEAKAVAKNLRTTPRKARLVADAIRGRKVGDALVMLDHGIHRQIAKDWSKLLKSAVANLQNRHTDSTVDVDGLRIAEIHVEQGPTMKRFRARSQGRYGSILKRNCHISVTVSN